MALYNLPEGWPGPLVKVLTRQGMLVEIPELEAQIQSMLKAQLNSPYNLCYKGQPTDVSYYRQSFRDWAFGFSTSYNGIANGKDIGELADKYFETFQEIIGSTPLDQSKRKVTGSILDNLGKRDHPMDFSNDPDATA